MKKKVILAIVCALLLCCCYVHRRVIKGLITKSYVPKAPKWHFWVKPENRRS